MKTEGKIAVLLGAIVLALLVASGYRENERQISLRYELQAPAVAKITPVAASDDPEHAASPDFAVIHGGVPTLKEFCLLHDSAFAGFNCGTARELEIPNDIRVYMTFRKNGAVVWTKKPVLVHKGEKIYTDGSRSFLARCANEIRFVPQEPSMNIETTQLERSAPREEVFEYSSPTSAPPAAGGGGAIASSSNHSWIAAVAAIPIIIRHDSHPVPPKPPCDAIEFGDCGRR